MFDFDKPYVNFNKPCKCCREQCISVGNGYCRTHYMELLTQAILGQYPVTGKDLIRKMDKPKHGSRQIPKQRDEDSTIS